VTLELRGERAADARLRSDKRLERPVGKRIAYLQHRGAMLGGRADDHALVRSFAGTGRSSGSSAGMSTR
jgi:hypothetical protein